MQQPSDWPRSALFQGTSQDARKQQKLFYKRAYGHIPTESLTERIASHLAYLDYVMLPEAQRLAQAPQAEGKDYSQLLLGLDDL